MIGHIGKVAVLFIYAILIAEDTVNIFKAVLNRKKITAVKVINGKKLTAVTFKSELRNLANRVIWYVLLLICYMIGVKAGIVDTEDRWYIVFFVLLFVWYISSFVSRLLK